MKKCLFQCREHTRVDFHCMNELRFFGEDGGKRPVTWTHLENNVFGAYALGDDAGSVRVL